MTVILAIYWTAAGRGATLAAEMLDARHWSNEWAPIDDAVYLNTAAHGVMPRVAAEAVQAAVTANQQPHRFDDVHFFTAVDSVRASLATLIGAKPHGIALTTGATTGLHVLAHHLPWTRGDEIITAAGEFPIQYTAWKPMERRAGATLKVVAPRGAFMTAADLIDAMTPKTRLVSVSHVRFDDGSLLDARQLADACHARGALLVLDVSQSCGNLPIDAAALGADVLVGAGYKWLLSPYGTGWFWMSDEMLDAMLPGPYSWTGQPERSFVSLNMLAPEPCRDARRWDAAEMATDLNLNLAAMTASVELVLRFGAAAVVEHNRQLIDRMFARLPDHCVPASPIEPGARGAFGCFTARRPEQTAALHERLTDANVVVSLRNGRIRVSPHLFNSAEQIDRLIDALGPS